MKSIFGKKSNINRLIVVLLILIMGISTFAAVVSDNDGAAFITKAEFDSLKNNFQSELNNYNSSLDDKIDGAIASYIEGVRVSKKSKLKSTLAVAGQTYQGVARKSYVFCGNNSVYFMCRYNYENQQFINFGVNWNTTPTLSFRYYGWLTSYAQRPTISGGGLEWFGLDQCKIGLDFCYRQQDDTGNLIPDSSGGTVIIFVVDNKNYVTTYKYNAEMIGRAIFTSAGTTNDGAIMAIPFVADNTHKWKFTFKDIVGANGTNGMGYSTRALNDSNANDWTGYRYQLFANESSSRSGWSYLNKTITDRSGTVRYIMNYGTSASPYQIARSNYTTNSTVYEWVDTHLHFEESRFGESYAWCMPFGHLLPDRKAACFKQWPAWESVNWVSIDTQNVGSIASSADKIFTDVSGQHHFYQQTGNANFYYMNGLSRTFFNTRNLDVKNFIEFDGMLPIWKENPLKDWRLLKNSNIKNALSIDAYYAAAPPLTSKFEKKGTFTWVAKVNQQDVERIPGRNFANWGNNRIYFTSEAMDDIEYSGTNVKVSNTKKFKYKKHGTTDAWSDCQSQVLDGKTYYYQTLEHDTYYDFKMDVASQETVYYMIFDELRPDDYCLEVIEHPDYQIEFEEKE